MFFRDEDVGASQLVIDGKIKLKNDSQIARFEKDKIIFENGSELPADVVIFALVFVSESLLLSSLHSCPATTNPLATTLLLLILIFAWKPPPVDTRGRSLLIVSKLLLVRSVLLPWVLFPNRLPASFASFRISSENSCRCVR